MNCLAKKLVEQTSKKMVITTKFPTREFEYRVTKSLGNPSSGVTVKPLDALWGAYSICVIDAVDRPRFARRR